MVNWLVRLYNRWKYRPTLQNFWEPGDGQKIVSVVQFQDILVIATEYRLYTMTSGHKSLWDLEIQQIANLCGRDIV